MAEHTVDASPGAGVTKPPSIVGSKRSLVELVDEFWGDDETGRVAEGEAVGGKEEGEPRRRPVITRGRRTRRWPVGLRTGGSAHESIEAVEVAASLTDLANGPAARRDGGGDEENEAWLSSGDGDDDDGASSPLFPARRASRRVKQMKEEEEESAALLVGSLTRPLPPETAAPPAPQAVPPRAPRPAAPPPLGNKSAGGKSTKLVVLPMGAKSVGGVGQSKAPSATKAAPSRTPSGGGQPPPSKTGSKSGGGNVSAKGGQAANGGGGSKNVVSGGGAGKGGAGQKDAPSGRLRARHERDGGKVTSGRLRALSAADREAVDSGVRVDKEGYPVTSFMSGMPDSCLTTEELRGRLRQWKERYFSAERENAQRAGDLVEVELRNHRLAQQVDDLEEQLAAARQEVEDAAVMAEAARQMPAPAAVARHAPTERPRLGSTTSSTSELVGLLEEAQARLLEAGFPHLLRKFMRSALSGHIAPSADSLWWNLLNDTSANLLQQHSNKYFFSLKVKQTIYCMSMLPTGRHAYNLLRGDAGGGVDSWDVSRANYNIPLPSPKTLMSFAAQNPRMAAEANEIAARHGGGGDKGGAS